MRAGRHAARDDPLRADGDHRQTEGHLDAARVHEPDQAHLHRRAPFPNPEETDPAFVGYSIGKWSDTDNDGTYDTLEVETRYMRGPRLFDSVGTPLSKDNETVVNEKIYLDKSNPDVLWNEITTQDGALTRPWTVKRFYKREKHPLYAEYNCTEDNRWVAIGGELYLADSEGYLMPIQKGQSAPDPKYLQKYFPPAKKCNFCHSGAPRSANPESTLSAAKTHWIPGSR